MHPPAVLRDLVLLVVFAIPVVALTHRLRVPAVVGFLLAGILIGPHGLGVVAARGEVEVLSEMGAVLLLFAVGLELSLSRVMKLGRSVLMGGAGQVLLTAAAVGAVAWAAGLAPNRAAFVGALVAVSSTAIILKIYAGRGELDSAHGRVVIAIAVFQDLAVVPLMLAVPLLAGGAAAGAGSPLAGVAVSLAVVAGIVIVGRLAVPRVLERIVRLRNRELFTMAVVAVGLGAAFVAAEFGVSLALGAFLAGLVLSESEYGLQALADVLPFRDVFSGIFFLSIGMLLDPAVVAAHPLALAAGLAGIVIGKAVIAALVVRGIGRPVATSIIAGLGLAQIGEFSFVLAGAGAAAGLLTAEHYQLFLAATVLSMLVAPFVILAAPAVAARVAGLLGGPVLEAPTEEQIAAAALNGHVIVVGYGLNGRNVARALRAVEAPYVILEQNGQVVRAAREAGEPILFGDGANEEVLAHVGVARARVVVFAIAEARAEARGVAAARRLNPAAHIVVRTRYVSAAPELERAGANEVVPEEFATSLELFATVLRHLGVTAPAIRRLLDEVRRDHFRTFAGRATARLSPLHQLGALGVEIEVDTLDVPPSSAVAGASPASLRLGTRTGALVLAVIRDGVVVDDLGPGFAFAPRDLAVMVGTEAALAKARGLFEAAA